MKYLLICCMIFTVALTSCGDDAIVKPTKDKSWEWTKDEKLSDKAPCFAMIYPVTLILPDDAGTEVTVDSKEEWHDVLADWKKDHPDAAQYPELQYPVDVEIFNGDIRTLETAEELTTLKKKCEDWVGESDHACFGYIFR